MLDQLAKTLEREQLMPANQTYIVAVSGGLDSIVLLDVLSQLAERWNWRLVVGHVEHGQRTDSVDDALFVSQVADRAGHTFLLHRLRPGRSSENRLRRARHAWLEAMRSEHNAQAVVTA